MKSVHVRSSALLLVLLVASACGPDKPAEEPLSNRPIVSPAISIPLTPPANSAKGSDPKTYSGHGAESVSPEILAKFAPPPLPADLSRRIQSMLDVRAPGGGLVAPDGKRLFFTWAVTGIGQVWRLDGPQRFPVQMTGGEDATNVAAVSPDGKFILVSRDRKGEENPGLYLQSAEGGPLTAILHQPKVQAFVEYVTDDSKAIYYRANDIKTDSFAIYKYDVATKKRELVFDQEGLWKVADHRPDGRLLMLKETGSARAEYSEYVPQTKTLTPLFGQGEKEEYDAEYGADANEVLVSTPKLGEFRRLYRWKSGNFTPVTPDIKFDLSNWGIDKSKKRITYEVNEAGFTRLHVLDAHTFKEIKLPALPPADHVFGGSTTRDGRFSVIGLNTGKSPNISFVLDWTSGKLTQWNLPSAPEIDTTEFVRAVLENYPAKDGTPIPMFVRRPVACEKNAPNAASAAPCPVVVAFHGGPEGQSVPGFNVRAQLFVDAGFVYAEPNVRGSEGYGKTWFHADDGPKRLSIITDIEDAAKYVRANWGRGGVAPKVGIYGGSYGGYSTLVGMTMFAGAYDAGASIVGIGSLVTFLQNTAPYRRALRVNEYGDPEKDLEALKKLSPMTYLDRVKAPLLIVQGASDPRVPVGEALQMHEALEAKKIPSKLIIFADEGHGSQKRENRVLEMGHVLQFFKEHLKGRTP